MPVRSLFTYPSFAASMRGRAARLQRYIQLESKAGSFKRTQMNESVYVWSGRWVVFGNQLGLPVESAII